MLVWSARPYRSGERARAPPANAERATRARARAPPTRRPRPNARANPPTGARTPDCARTLPLGVPRGRAKPRCRVVLQAGLGILLI